MSIDMRVALASERAEDEATAARRAWIAIVLTATGATIAVLLTSFVAVISGLT
jgi:hypothetical protein